MRTLGPPTIAIILSALVILDGGALTAEDYPRNLEVPADQLPYVLSNPDGNVEILVLEGGGISADVVDRFVSLAIETQPEACKKSIVFRVQAVASWSDVQLALVSRTECGLSSYKTLVHYSLATDTAKRLWGDYFPSAPTTTGFRTIAETPDLGLVFFETIPWYEGAGDVTVIDFQGKYHGQFGAERFLGPQEVSGTEVFVFVVGRYVAGTECPPDVNDELKKNNESLIGSCHIQEFQPVVFWASGCSQLDTRTSVFGCSGRYCGPLPGEPTPDDMIPQFTNVSELPSECSYWNP